MNVQLFIDFVSLTTGEILDTQTAIKSLKEIEKTDLFALISEHSPTGISSECIAAGCYCIVSVMNRDRVPLENAVKTLERQTFFEIAIMK